MMRALRVAELQPAQDAPGFPWLERSVEGGSGVGVEVDQDHQDDRGLRVALVYQPPHLRGEINHRAAHGDVHMAPVALRLEQTNRFAVPLRRYS